MRRTDTVHRSTHTAQRHAPQILVCAVLRRLWRAIPLVDIADRRAGACVLCRRDWRTRSPIAWL